MNDIQGLAQMFSFDYEGNVDFWCALGYCQHTDAVAPEYGEEFSRNTRIMGHRFAYNSYGREFLVNAYGQDGTLADFVAEFFVDELFRPVGIFMFQPEGNARFGRALADEEHGYIVFGKGGEDASVNSYYIYHRNARKRQQAGIVNGRYSPYALAARRTVS